MPKPAFKLLGELDNSSRLCDSFVGGGISGCIARTEGVHQASQILAVLSSLICSGLGLACKLIGFLSLGSAVGKLLSMLLKLIVVVTNLNFFLLITVIEVGIHLLDTLVSYLIELLDIVLKMTYTRVM